MERIVMVGYRPIKGKEKELEELSKTHWKELFDLGLVTKRLPVLMKAGDGTIIEIFGWKSKDAMKEAHSNDAVLNIWKKYAQVCEYVPVGSLTESQNLFSEFSPLL